MELTKEKQRQLAVKLQQSRLRLIERQPFYGLLLLYVKFSLDVGTDTAWTDGKRIAFSPEFLDSLSDSEVDFVLEHEILHIVLSHVSRGKEFADREIFNIATDIVVNSNILYSEGGNLSAITLSNTGESMHNLPDGREGYDYSAEELYPIIAELEARGDLKYEDLTSKRKKKKKNSAKSDGPSGLQGIKPLDSHDKWSDSQNGDNGSSRQEGSKQPQPSKSEDNNFGSDKDMQDLWLKRMVDTTTLINSLNDNVFGSKSCGSIPKFMERIISELKNGSIDWRTMLQNFVEEDVCDYSFCPPDYRFQDSPFFLPAFNETEESVRNILFWIDTSGSMSDDMVLDAFSEVKWAIDQFGGKLSGSLGFFDAAAYEPIPFESVDDLLKIKPRGGGGTSFDVVFKYVRDKMPEAPASIIILTDGYADFPDESAAQGIPVLWLINNDEVTPEWGKVARIKSS